MDECWSKYKVKDWHANSIHIVSEIKNEKLFRFHTPKRFIYPHPVPPSPLNNRISTNAGHELRAGTRQFAGSAECERSNIAVVVGRPQGL